MSITLRDVLQGVIIGNRLSVPLPFLSGRSQWPPIAAPASSRVGSPARALGAAPVSLPLSEAYQALQTKVADGQENPLALIESAKFYEVQKFCSLTNHAWDGFWFVASGRVWKGIPADVQQVMQKHMNAAAKKQRDDIVRANADLQKSLEGKGLAFDKVDPAPFQAALKSSGFYKQAQGQFGPEAWALLRSTRVL